MTHDPASALMALAEEYANELVAEVNEAACWESTASAAPARAALRAAIEEAVKVPQGWKLVPDSATQNMLNAANQGRKKGRSSSGDIYAAMLNAAPPADAALKRGEG